MSVGKEQIIICGPDVVEINGKRISRNDFGIGRLGDDAWLMISAGTMCAAIIDGQQCNSFGIETIDFDVIGDPDILPDCGPEHRRIIEQIITDELAQQESVNCVWPQWISEEHLQDNPGIYILS